MWRAIAIGLLVGGCDTDCSIEARVFMFEPIELVDCGVLEAAIPANHGLRIAMRDCVLAAAAAPYPFMAIWEIQGIEYGLRQGLAGSFVDGVWSMRYYEWRGGTISGDAIDVTTAWECASLTDVGPYCSTGNKLCIECERGPEVDRCSDR